MAYSALLTKIRNKAAYTIRNQEEQWLGKRIIKHIKHTSPDFMIIGVAKAGTTSLFQYLTQHPAVVIPTIKELKYFENKNRQRGLRWYLANFPLKEDAKNKLAFEASPTYLYMKQSPERIAHLFPGMKFIVILRDPVKRSFSHWNFYHDQSNPQNRAMYYDERTFEQAVEEELNDELTNIPDYKLYLYKSMYSQHLKHWYQYYPPEKILTLDFENLKNNPKYILKKVTEFLSIKFIYEDFEETREQLQGDKYTKDDNSQKIKQYNTTPYKKEMSDKMETKLRTLFDPYDKELEKLTGRKFSWMQ
jgi:hypothetical protein